MYIYIYIYVNTRITAGLTMTLITLWQDDRPVRNSGMEGVGDSNGGWMCLLREARPRDTLHTSPLDVCT